MPGHEIELLEKLKSKRTKESKELAELIEGKAITCLVGKSTVNHIEQSIENFVTYVNQVAKAKILPLVTKANILGATHMGLFSKESHLLDFVEKARERKIKTLIVSGTDFISNSIYSKELKDAMTYIEFIVSLDMFVNDTSQRSDLILPVTTFTEKDGTFTNIESRVSRQNQAIPVPGQAKSDWEIVNDLLGLLGYEGIGNSEFEINEKISKEIKGYSEATFLNLDKPSNRTE